MGTLRLERIARPTGVVERLAAELDAASRTDPELRRLCTVPGIGPVAAGAIAAFAPDMSTVESGRNFAACRATRVIRWVVRKGGGPNPRLAALVARKPRMVAAVAPADKMARTIRAMSVRGKDCRMA